MKREIILKIIIFSFFFFLSTIFFTFAQKNREGEIFTRPYIRFDAETEISAPLNFSTKEGFKGKLEVKKLTENRTYTLPDLSGEICLSAGNCQIGISQFLRGKENKLPKFTAGGILESSSIEDLAKETSIFIDENGNVGIGMTPDFKLHVAGKIQARDDICTDLEGRICLSQIKNISQKLTSLAEATIEGAGTPERVPIWKKNYQLGDSVIYQEGENIGIGMIPSFKLDVAGTVRMLGFRLPVSPKEGYGLISDDKGFGTWKPVLQPESAGGDVAEKFPINPECKKENDCPKPGDLVSLNERGEIEKTKNPYDKRLIGVISENPTLLMRGVVKEEESLPVALIGRVKVKVSILNGEIEIGDPLTSSEIPGIAKKATNPGKIVGFALENLKEEDFKGCKEKEKILDCENKIGKIDVLVNLQFFIGQEKF